MGGCSVMRGALSDTGGTVSEQLRGVLHGMHDLLLCLGASVRVRLDVLQRVDQNTYGPGLVFRVLVREGTEQTVICAGGQIDNLLGPYAKLHCGSRVLDESKTLAKDKNGLIQLSGVGIELAVDKLASCVPQSPVLFQNRLLESHAAGGCSVMHQAEASIRPNVLLMVVDDSAIEHGLSSNSVDSAPHESLLGEAMIVAGTLWRLGLRCDIQLGCAAAASAMFDISLMVKSAPPQVPARCGGQPRESPLLGPADVSQKDDNRKARQKERADKRKKDWTPKEGATPQSELQSNTKSAHSEPQFNHKSSFGGVSGKWVYRLESASDLGLDLLQKEADGRRYGNSYVLEMNDGERAIAFFSSLSRQVA